MGLLVERKPGNVPLALPLDIGRRGRLELLARTRRAVLKRRVRAWRRPILCQRGRRGAGQQRGRNCSPHHPDTSPTASPNVVNFLTPALLISAPPRTDSIRPADEDRLDPADLVVLDLEQLAQ